MPRIVSAGGVTHRKLQRLGSRADRAAKPSGSRHFYEQAGSKDRTLKFYEGRYHDPLNDLGKEEVFADILGWIETRLPT